MDKPMPVAQNKISVNPCKTGAAFPHGKEKNRGQSFLNVCLAVVMTLFCGCAALAVYSQVADLHSVREETAALQEPEIMRIANTPSVPKAEATPQPYISEFDADMRKINEDYVCWLKIDGTDISYPVVRGDNNDDYLGLSFYGEDNYFGSIFMDCRCAGDNVPNIIIFGHNSRQGDMFGSLRNFLDNEYYEQHPVITLIVNDRAVEYEVFSVRKTNINDPAYFLDFSNPDAFCGFLDRCGAPPDAAQILTLSTCVSGVDKNERVIVQAVLM